MSPKSLDVSMHIAGVEKKKNARKTCGGVNIGGHSIRLSLKERSVSGGGNLCPLGLVILKSV